MNADISMYINREIACSCGKVHFCPITDVVVRSGALEELAQRTEAYRKIFVVADGNTWAVCGETVWNALAGRVSGRLIYEREGVLVPDEPAMAELSGALPEEADFVLGVGSGVINDLCKYVSFKRGLECGIVATAPSMDGYASSGAAMIVGGMKVTYTMHPPKLIVADVDVVKNAPMDMIRAGYGDIIGKYSSLNDWRLSNLMTGEYFCPEIHDLVLAVTDDIRDSVKAIIGREEEAIAKLMRALILIGVTLSLVGSTRPGSGSEHHLSHFFEIVGLTRSEPYFVHGTDVAYSTIVTAGMREKIAAMEKPVFRAEAKEAREAAWQRIYGPVAGEVVALQQEAGCYERNLRPAYAEKWDEIRALMAECPTAEACGKMFEDAGYRLADFEKLYGREKIHDAELYGKDLKNRYSVLWLYYELFSGEA